VRVRIMRGEQRDPRSEEGGGRRRKYINVQYILCSVRLRTYLIYKYLWL